MMPNLWTTSEIRFTCREGNIVTHGPVTVNQFELICESIWQRVYSPHFIPNLFGLSMSSAVPVDQVLKFLNTTTGREKLYRTIQYFSR